MTVLSALEDSRMGETICKYAVTLALSQLERVLDVWISTLAGKGQKATSSRDDGPKHSPDRILW